MIDFWLWGGHSYVVGDPEQFPSLEDACCAYVDRHEGNGIRPIDGILYPTWGDCADDEYVITDSNGDGWTRAEVFAIAG